jgi:hypothetical protein
MSRATVRFRIGGFLMLEKLQLRAIKEFASWASFLWLFAEGRPGPSGKLHKQA